MVHKHSYASVRHSCPHARHDTAHMESGASFDAERLAVRAAGAARDAGPPVGAVLFGDLRDGLAGARVHL